ncbi:ras gtpase-activating protein [Anaeramoeba flamelloides]|uniref:Ras gtpase-activating protein n=1 Tax=Anaeramoeba flamelloides TaxID=1746091 RepID=A0AAV7YS22_9EUKA|nr:ras gtpase-activating protein [Anaeramoeba flamelloides]
MDSNIFLESKEIEEYYVKIVLNRNSMKTPVLRTIDLETIKGQFLFLVKNRKASLKLQLYGSGGLLKKKSKISSFEIAINSLAIEKPIQQWYHFKSTHKKLKEKRIGSVMLFLHLTPLSNQTLNEKTENRWRKKYHELIKHLLSNNHEILYALSDVVHSGDADEVAKALVEILSNMKLPDLVQFIKGSIEREVENTDLAPQLFRSNSMATKMMTSFSKQVGSEYLKNTFEKIITQIVKQQVRIEIDPRKLKENENLEEMFKILRQYVKSFLDLIYKSTNYVPSVLREICQQLMLSVGKKFPDHKEISIAGVFFLRYLCPAIINPESFHIITNIQVGNTRRTLIIIAKVIQTFVNRIEMGVKDRNLQPLSGFTKNNIEQLDNFLYKISNQEEGEEKKEKEEKKKEKEKEPIELSELVLLRTHLTFYLDKIDALLFDTEENQEKNKEENEEQFESSLINFLGGEDPVFKLAMLLNGLKSQPKITRQFHSIPNKVLLNRKVIKITDDIGTLISKEKEEIRVLNTQHQYTGEARKPLLVSESLVTEMINLYKKYLNQNYQEKEREKEKEKENERKREKEKEEEEEEKQVNNETTWVMINNIKVTSMGNELLNQEREKIKTKEKKKKKGSLHYYGCNWKQLKESEEYDNFVQKTSELGKINLANLNQFELVTFWINTINLFILHASVENGGGPSTIYQRKEFNTYNNYLIGDCTYSIDDIIHGIFRGNPKNFRGSRYFKSKDDPRRVGVIKQFSPYLHFAISYLEYGSPFPYIYHPDNLEKELLLATKLFFEKHITLLKRGELILTLPMKFKWNKSDFGKSEDAICEFIMNTARKTYSDLSKTLLKISQLEYSITYQNNHELDQFKEWINFDNQNNNENLTFLQNKMLEKGNNFKMIKGQFFTKFIGMDLSKEIIIHKRSKSEPNIFPKIKRTRSRSIKKIFRIKSKGDSLN